VIYIDHINNGGDAIKQGEYKMLQAIQVKYLSATDKRGSRFKATSAGGSVTVSMDYELDYETNATEAAYALIKKMDWAVEISGSGVLPNGDEVFTVTAVD
jgi:hypothetical protein